MSATPSEAPRFIAVPCRPPASLPRSAGTDDMMTLPNCDTSKPLPRRPMPARHEAGGAQVRAGERDEQDQPAEHQEQAGGGDPLG